MRWNEDACYLIPVSIIIGFSVWTLNQRAPGIDVETMFQHRGTLSYILAIRIFCRIIDDSFVSRSVASIALQQRNNSQSFPNLWPIHSCLHSITIYNICNDFYNTLILGKIYCDHIRVRNWPFTISNNTKSLVVQLKHDLRNMIMYIWWIIFWCRIIPYSTNALQTPLAALYYKIWLQIVMQSFYSI